MSVAAPTTLVWIDPAPPDRGQASALASWAQERGILLMDPSRRAPRALPIDDAVAGEIEDLLKAARDAIVAREPDAADRALEAAEDRLRVHAELPQAAWLMAELERVRSTRWRRVAPIDTEAAARAWARAEAIDGGRVAGVGEVGAGDSAGAAEIAIEVPAGDRAWIDGSPATGARTATHAGPHAVRVTWGGRTVWASWLDLPVGDSTVATDAPSVAPCSLADTASAHLGGATGPNGAVGPRVVDADAVLCPQWVAAAPGATAGTVSVALCAAGRCGPLLDWHRTAVSLFSGVTTRPEGHSTRGWPTWATWTLVGAGVAIGAAAAIVASGALKPAPAETIFVNGGLKVQ